MTRRYEKTIKVSEVKTHKFFTLDAETLQPNNRDEENRIKVYGSQQRAKAEAIAKHGEKPLLVVGMGDDKWTDFQKREQYVLV